MDRKEPQTITSAILLPVFGLLFGVTASFAQGVAVQEKADVEFRTLTILLDDHSGIYSEYTANDPTDLTNHLVVEMLGDPDNRIETRTLKSFVDESFYYGAFTVQYKLLSRQERVEIDRTAKRLRDRAIPIDYIDNAAFGYLHWSDLNSNFELDSDDEIIRMRSDAFVEYCYTINSAPIVTFSGETIVTDPQTFITEAAFQRLLPSNQRAELRIAPTGKPTITMLKGRCFSKTRFSSQKTASNPPRSPPHPPKA